MERDSIRTISVKRSKKIDGGMLSICRHGGKGIEKESREFGLKGDFKKLERGRRMIGKDREVRIKRKRRNILTRK